MIFSMTCSPDVQTADVEQFFGEFLPSMGIHGEFIVEHRYKAAPSYNGRNERLESTYTVRFGNEKDQFIASLKVSEFPDEELRETYNNWFACEYAQRVTKALNRREQ